MTVGLDTPSARPISALFQWLPWKWATIVQKRRMVAAGTDTPSCGRSRSRNVRMNAFRQRTLPASCGARKDDGKPPRNQSGSRASTPVSSTRNGVSSWYAIRPASVSDDWRSRSGPALPSTSRIRIADLLLAPLENADSAAVRPPQSRRANVESECPAMTATYCRPATS